ncbi:Exopolygalacturonase [Varicellaria rhodocarpa]|nr:Exopolygalacturonase [Varicellaria rhodocarpa]
MRFKALELLLLAQSASIIASSALCAREPTVEPTIQAKRLSQRLSPRPSWFIGAYHPSRPYPSSLERNKECYVKSHNDGKTDDSPYILQAIHACDHGGHVVFPKGIHYIIGTALNLTFLSHIDIDIQGYIQFTNDTDYWQASAFKQIFQNVTTFQLGGEDVNVYGGGTLDGNGQVWYDLYAQDIYILRPVLFGTIGLKSGSISNLNLIYSPQYYNFVANSSDVLFSNIAISGFSKSSNTAKNTDGWDTYRSDGITIQNSTINNGDDCVSFKPNSTNMLVQNLQCNGSHGISVGSLGQYVGETDLVENVYVYNVSMSNASDGARIKVWPGSPAELSGDLQGGGGTGAVRNVTYDTMSVENVAYGIEVTQCYGQKNITLCNQFPVRSPLIVSTLTITDVVFKNFHGTTDGSYSPLVGNLVCSSPNVCANITASGIEIVSPTGTNLFTCLDIDEAMLAVNCTTLNKGYNKL